MITLEQLDELEGRIVRALELIGDLRSENSRLENENERLRTEHDELKIALDEKEKTVHSLKEQLDRTGTELNELKQKESILEKRITEMLSRLSDVGQPGTHYSAPIKATHSVVEEAKSTEQEIVSAESKQPEPVVRATAVDLNTSTTDESVVVLDDQDLPLEKAAAVSLSADRVTEETVTESAPVEIAEVAKVETETEHGFTKQAAYEREKEDISSQLVDDDIIILDDDDDDVVFADDDEIEILEIPETNEPAGIVAASDFAPPPVDDDIILDDDDDLGIFDMDDDEDFLIVEEDTRST